MAYFGVDKQVRIEELNLQFKHQVRQNGQMALHKLRMLFKQADKNGNGKLDLREFELVLSQYGFFPSMNDLKQLHAYYDKDGDGHISYEEFINSISDSKLTPRKQAVIDKMWAQMDTEGAGKCKGSDVMANLQDPDSMRGVLERFAQTKGGEESGNVIKEEFYQLFLDLSAQVPDDNTFIETVESSWKVKEDGDNKLDNIRVMHLLGLMRQRLITKANEKQEEYKLRDMFRNFDKDKSGSLSINELAGLLSELGVAVNDNELVAMMKVLDTSKNGVIEFDEFQNFVVIDPYKKFEFSGKQ